MPRTTLILASIFLALLGLHAALAQDASTPPPPAPKPDPALLRYLNVRYAGAGRFSADGREIAFTTNWTGTSQKWRIPVDGGFPQQITFFEDSIDFCDFSPVEAQLMLCGVASGGNERTQLYFTAADGTGLTPFYANPDVIHRMGDWSRDGRLLGLATNERDSQFFDVYVHDMQTGQRKLVLQKDANLGALGFSPGGKYMLLAEYMNNFDNNVYLAQLATGVVTLLTPHADPARYGSCCWADDHTVYLLSSEGREFTGLARMDVAFPKLEWLVTPQHDVEDLNVSDDGRYIAWSENVDGFGEVHLATLPDFAPLPAPAMPAGVQRVGSFDRQNRYVLLQVSGPAGPTDLWRYELATGETLRLTYSSTGGLDRKSFVEARAVRYQSFDGLTISALLYEPRGERPAGGWPAIVMAHGGPEGQVRPWFDPLSQLYLSHGVALMMPNVRGSDGCGKRFSHLDDVGLREDSVRDYACARDWLVAQGIADPARIAITGASYGGYVVLAALTLDPDKWAAGVCSVGIANFVTFLENTAPHRRGVREAEYGSLQRDRALLERLSPVHKAAQITAPLLLVHGENDPRVPIGEAKQMYEALSGLGREVQLLSFPDEGHGTAKLENRALAWEREVAFLGAHLGFK
jgi:dipeptidyl aminopeptidase/acylaminoacyl peptidase